MPSPIASVQHLGRSVLLTGAALHDVRNLCTKAISQARREDPSIQVNPRLQALIHAVAAAISETDAMAHNGHRDVARENDLTPWEPERRIGTRQAATILGLSTRQTQRIARSLDGRRLPNGAWIFDHDTVCAYNLNVRDNRYDNT